MLGLLTSLKHCHVVFVVSVTKTIPSLIVLLFLGFSALRHYTLNLDFFEGGRHEVSRAHPIHEDLTSV